MKSAVIIFLVIAISGIVHSKTLELDNDIMQPDMMDPEQDIMQLDMMDPEQDTVNTDVLAREDDIDSANVSDINRYRDCKIVGEAEFCYYTKPALTFGEGEEFCKTKNGHLASINSKKEQDAVTKLIKSYSGGTSYTWIGYIDNMASGLDWNWIDGMGGYTNWYTNYPINAGTYLCAMHKKACGRWLNTYCQNKYSVLCRMYKSH